jgi:CRP-like cAMP-binding protein
MVTNPVPYTRSLHNPEHSGNHTPGSPHARMAAARTALERIGCDLKKPAKNVVFRQGENADFIYFLQSGAIRLDYQLENGRSLVLDFLWPGRFFGITEDTVYAWSAITLVDAHIKRLRRSTVQTLARNYPDITDLLLKQKTAALMAAKNHIVLMSHPTATSKLIGFLLAYSKQPEYFDQTTQVLTLIMSRKDIADYLGMTFETASRIFKYLEIRNYIKKINHRQIQLNIHMLRNP